METINISKDGLIEGFTKYIIDKNGNLSPSLRFDLGGKYHRSNTIDNKYFSNTTETPHIHFSTLYNDEIIQNAISLKNLQTYFSDLINIPSDTKPEKDIFENSYGMPYLDIKKKYGNSKIKDYLNSINKAIDIFEHIKQIKNELKKSNYTSEQINQKLESLRFEFLSKCCRNNIAKQHKKLL